MSQFTPFSLSKSLIRTLKFMLAKQSARGNVETGITTVSVQDFEASWWETHSWTIIQVLIGIGGLIVAILAYLTRTREEKKKKK